MPEGKLEASYQQQQHSQRIGETCCPDKNNSLVVNRGEEVPVFNDSYLSAEETTNSNTGQSVFQQHNRVLTKRTKTTIKISDNYAFITLENFCS